MSYMPFEEMRLDCHVFRSRCHLGHCCENEGAIVVFKTLEQARQGNDDARTTSLTSSTSVCKRIKSCITVLRAMYSASIVETIISVCNLDTQWTGQFQNHQNISHLGFHAQRVLWIFSVLLSNKIGINKTINC